MIWACEGNGGTFGEDTKIKYERCKTNGEPQMGWADNVKSLRCWGGMSVEQGRLVVGDQKEWRTVVNGYT